MRYGFLTTLGLAMVLTSAVNAADALKPSVFEVKIAGAAAGAPEFEKVNGQLIFKLNSAGTLSGDLTGTYTQRVIQVGAEADIATRPVNLNQPIATFFTMTTDKGTIEGYYEGVFYFPEGGYPNAESHQIGKVLSVTGAYADLFMADVYYEAGVKFEHKDGVAIGISDAGTIVLAARR